MTGGGWHSQEQRHGRHRRGVAGAAWTPVVRPTDMGPVHAARDGFVPFMRPMDASPVSEVLTRRPGWPEDPLPPVTWSGEVMTAQDRPPAARSHAARRPAHPPPANVARLADGTDHRDRARSPRERPHGAPTGPGDDTTERARCRAAAPMVEEPVWPPDEPPQEGPQVPVALQRSGHSAPPKRRTISSDMLDAVPTEAVLYPFPETPATGLRKFDLGNVPASVTPPRSWRRAAWFAVGTSAAVVLGLTVAAVELMGRPISDNTIIDALPEYPLGPMTLERLPDHNTTKAPLSGPATSSHGRTTTPGDTVETGDRQPPPGTVAGTTTTADAADRQPSAVQTTETPNAMLVQNTTTTPAEPPRRTVGAEPIVPTSPQAMGDRTVEYFRLVTSDPAAACALTAGSMAGEGAAGIEARYGDVARIEVQDITIDRDEAVTMSTVKVVHDDGTGTIEHHRLSFTWGDDPKITDDSTTE